MSRFHTIRDYRNALDAIYEKLCAVELLLTTKDQARLVGMSIESCKYLKEPEWSARAARRREEA